MRPVLPPFTQPATHSNSKIVWSAVALLISLLALALWLVWSPSSLQAHEPALAGNAQSLPQELVPLDGIAHVAAGYYHTCALSTAGAVKCWGYNEYGQLGDGTGGNKTTPVDVAGLGSGVAAIAAGGYHTCALTTAGGVKCWGRNYYGQLGDGTTADKRTPVDVAGLGSGVAAIAAGGWHTCALSTAGGVKCWGYNYSGQLGDGTTASKSTPVDVAGLGSGVAAIAAGWVHTCALSTASGVKCWGYNGSGQLGDGTTANRSTPVEVLVEGTGTATYHISGRISDGDGNPIADVTISAGSGYSVTTGGSGSYELTGLIIGTFTITAAKEGYTFAPSSRSITLPPNGDNADFTGFLCAAPPSGLDLCNLQPGDILLKASPALGEGSSTDSFFIRLGGTYFTHSALYLGIVPDPNNPDKFTPRIAEAQGVAGGADDVWETALENTRFWSGDIVTDWAVVRPSVGQSVENSAINYARNKAAEDGVVFDINAERSDEKKFYCSKLVWRAYEQAGFKVDERRRFLDPASRFGWVTPDDLYYGSPEVQSKSVSLGREILKGFFGIYSPAHLTLTDAQGRKTGYDPATGKSVVDIPGSMYSGPDAEIESIHVADIGDTTGWQLVATGYEAGDYTVETGYVDPRTLNQIVHDVTTSGQVDTFTVAPPIYAVFLPLAIR